MFWKSPTGAIVEGLRLSWVERKRSKAAEEIGRLTQRVFIVPSEPAPQTNAFLEPPSWLRPAGTALYCPIKSCGPPVWHPHLRRLSRDVGLANYQHNSGPDPHILHVIYPATVGNMISRAGKACRGTRSCLILLASVGFCL